MKYLALLLFVATMASLIEARHKRSVVSLTLTAQPRLSVVDLTPEIKVKCSPSSSKNVLMAVLLHLEKVDENGTTSLVASKRINALLVADNNRTTAVGHLQADNDDEVSFVEVTIVDPQLEDTGTYQCRYAVIDEDLTVHSLGSKVNVNVTEVEPANYSPNNDCSCHEIWPEIDKLKAAIQARSEQPFQAPSPYDERCRTSFSARFATRYGYEILDDQTAVFDDVISNKGDGYNNKTGVFTAVCDGQYFITASLRSYQRRSSGYVDGVITVNDVERARTSVFHDKVNDNYQSATNGVVLSLQAGDEVKVVVRTTSSGEFVGIEYSIFSGFFIFP